MPPRIGLFLLWLISASCGDDGSGADHFLVGAECTSDDDCYQSSSDGGISETCLRQFKGGYCGVEDCVNNEDCPHGAACVAHDDGNNYCFRLCVDKPECNHNRSSDNEANCSGSVNYADGSKASLGKACVPPSSGI